ncbi:MAG: hypothetical protein HQK50_12020 [Oligoflexia bacterium]|nr:hypothetical protein [Oligoflexia bacterium]MBF0366291.1 hypothetical protein [Oligoflexia bacterium]
MHFSIGRIFVLAALMVISSVSAYDKIIELGAVAGVPQLMGLEAAFVGLPYTSIGAAMGTFPINSIMQKKLTLPKVSLGSDFEVHPKATYELGGPSFFARFFPLSNAHEGLFFQLGMAMLDLTANVTGDLYSKSLRRVLVSKVFTGKGELDEKVYALTVGYQYVFSSGIFFSGGVGIAKLTRPTYTVSIGGEYLLFMMFLPSLRAEFENAKRELEAEIAKEVDEFYQEYKYIPSIFASLGVRF